MAILDTHGAGKAEKQIKYTSHECLQRKRGGSHEGKAIGNAKQNGVGAEGQTKVQTGKSKRRGLVMALRLPGPQVPRFENKGTEQNDHKGPFSMKIGASGGQ